MLVSYWQNLRINKKSRMNSNFTTKVELEKSPSLIPKEYESILKNIVDGLKMSKCFTCGSDNVAHSLEIPSPFLTGLSTSYSCYYIQHCNEENTNVRIKVIIDDTIIYETYRKYLNDTDRFYVMMKIILEKAKKVIEKTHNVL